MKKRSIAIILMLCLVFSFIPADSILQADNGITEEKFIILLMKEMGLANVEGDKQSILEQAYAKKVVKHSEKNGLLSKLTKEHAAVYIERVDELVNGQQYDTNLYEKVLAKNRLSDLKKVKKSYRASVIKVYCKGIMIGYSNGYYVQSRKFCGKKVVSLSEAKTYLKRLKYPKKRRQISADGQLIRTTNLPSNKRSYPYILETYPNSFYEKKFEYQETKYGKKPVALVDYASPAKIGKMKFYNGVSMKSVMDKNLEKWCEKVARNMELRFIVDYRTIDNDWVSKLRSTYYVFEGDAQANKQRTDEIKDYVAMVKKNKVVVKCSRVTVEPSTLYNTWEDYVRVYVRFKIVNGNVENLGKVFYCEQAYIKNLKKNTWKECYFDVAIGSSNGNSLGSDYAVFSNMLVNIK